MFVCAFPFLFLFVCVSVRVRESLYCVCSARNSQFIHGGEHSLSASEASSTTGEPLEMYSWLQCENCKKWRRTATDSYELEGDAR